MQDLGTGRRWKTWSPDLAFSCLCRSLDTPACCACPASWGHRHRVHAGGGALASADDGRQDVTAGAAHGHSNTCDAIDCTQSRPGSDAQARTEHKPTVSPFAAATRGAACAEPGGIAEWHGQITHIGLAPAASGGGGAFADALRLTPALQWTVSRRSSTDCAPGVMPCANVLPADMRPSTKPSRPLELAPDQSAARTCGISAARLRELALGPGCMLAEQCTASEGWGG